MQAIVFSQSNLLWEKHAIASFLPLLVDMVCGQVASFGDGQTVNCGYLH